MKSWHELSDGARDAVIREMLVDVAVAWASIIISALIALAWKVL